MGDERYIYLLHEWLICLVNVYIPVPRMLWEWLLSPVLNPLRVSLQYKKVEQQGYPEVHTILLEKGPGRYKKPKSSETNRRHSIQCKNH